MLCHDENMITHKQGKPKITMSISIPYGVCRWGNLINTKEYFTSKTKSFE